MQVAIAKKSIFWNEMNVFAKFMAKSVLTKLYMHRAILRSIYNSSYFPFACVRYSTTKIVQMHWLLKNNMLSTYNTYIIQRLTIIQFLI